MQLTLVHAHAWMFKWTVYSEKNTFLNDDASIDDNAYNINDNDENSLAAKYYIYKLNKLFIIFHQNEEP